MKYFFVLGRNPQLSLAEIFAWLEKEGLPVKFYETRSNGLMIETDDDLDVKRAVNELGGTVALGRALFSGKVKEVLHQIKEKTIYLGKEIKVIYSLLNYSDDEVFENALDALKKNLAKEGLKARYKGVGGTIRTQQGDIALGSPSKIMLRDMNYFVFGYNDEICFGFLEASYNVKEAEKKDIGKPERRESLAISPRLARILINLSGAKKEEIILDPFCGIGVILQESLLRGINALGVDIDRIATSNAKKNIAWLEKNYRIEAKHYVYNEDSRKINLHDIIISGIASEPSLGKLLTVAPQKEEAIRMINMFESLMIDMLNNIKKFMRKGARAAFTAPLIRTADKKRIGCDIEKICEKTNLHACQLKGSERVKFPIQEFRQEQIVGREFFVLVNE